MLRVIFLLSSVPIVFSCGGDGKGDRPAGESMPINDNLEYSVSPISNFGGDVIPSSPQKVLINQDISFKITPDNGYRVLGISGCEGKNDGNYFTIRNVTSDCSFEVKFGKNREGLLNDTGIGGEDSGCDSGFSGLKQDCNQGRDYQSINGLLYKTGAGSGGFDFTKLDNAGNDLPSDAAAWSCVRDNHTGLIWEVKKPTGLHSEYDEFVWYSSDHSSNGVGGPFFDPIDTGKTCYGYRAGNQDFFCTTEFYVESVNSNRLCGFDDWRMPEIDELLSIMNIDDYKSIPDPAFFPTKYNLSYWSGTPSGETSAWVFNNNNGLSSRTDPISIDFKREFHRIRLVRR